VKDESEIYFSYSLSPGKNLSAKLEHDIGIVFQPLFLFVIVVFLVCFVHERVRRDR